MAARTKDAGAMDNRVDALGTQDDTAAASDTSGADEPTFTPGTAMEAGAKDDAIAVDDATFDAAMTGDATVCPGWFFDLKVNGAPVQTDHCGGGAQGSPGLYAYAGVGCNSPSLGTSASYALVAYGTASAADVTYYPQRDVTCGGQGTVTFTTFGAVGEFIDGTLSAPNLSCQGDVVWTQPPVTLEASFHVCRDQDSQWLGH
jgi:hypothetical protein